MPFDVVVLSRIQFALTIMFHYIFPPLSMNSKQLVGRASWWIRLRHPQNETQIQHWQP